MTAVVVGMAIACCNAFLNGTPGAKHHLGYGMLARAAFGLWGSYFCVILNVFQSFVFYVSTLSIFKSSTRLTLYKGTQMYFGGQAFVIVINSLSPQFMRMSNTLPERYEFPR